MRPTRVASTPSATPTTTVAVTPVATADVRAEIEFSVAGRDYTLTADVMTEEGVNGLSLSEVARRLGWGIRSGPRNSASIRASHSGS